MCFMFVQSKAINTHRGIDGHIGNVAPGNRSSCQSLCAGTFTLCEQLSTSIGEHMLCLKVNISCTLKCSENRLDKLKKREEDREFNDFF